MNRRGYAVEESATRFANYFHLLREVVHLSCGHLGREPRFEIKALVGDHIHDDARAVSKIQRRLDELGGRPGAPSTELAALLDRADDADTHEYLEIAYGELKPTLIAALRHHLENLDPLLDEPSLRLLTQLLHRQERHTAELPAAGRPAFEDLGALPLDPHATRALRVMPPLEQPARDAFVEITEDGVPTDDPRRYVHAQMHAELCAAELTARCSHEHQDMPWDFHVDMARQTWDHVRHAEVLDRLMTTELDCHWGDYPVSFATFRESYARDLAGRLAHAHGTIERRLDLGDEAIADYLQADEIPHERSAARWSR